MPRVHHGEPASSTAGAVGWEDDDDVDRLVQRADTNLHAHHAATLCERAR